MRHFIVCLILLGKLPILAQNLIINGSFERQPAKKAGVWLTPPKSCQFSGSSQIANTACESWTTFEVQTPDLLQYDTLAGCPNFPKPHKGSRMMGLIMYHPFQDGQFGFDYHELIQGTLSRPLEKGKTYRFSFWVYANDSLGVQHLNEIYRRSSKVSQVYCGNFGVYFSDSPINPRENFMLSQLDFPVKPQVNLEQIIETRGQWRKISMAYTAEKSGLKHFLFGNFYSDAVTRINMSDEARQALEEQNQQLEFWKKNKRIAYYLFDDFSLVEDPNAAIEQSILVDRNYVMPDVLLFDSGQSGLRPEAATAIRKLVEVLKKYPSLQFEIGGHTDDVGDDTANLTLSEKRAQTVFQAILEQGVPEKQLRWKGYGEHQPAVPNFTDEQRRKNRRVECKVVD
ncbi:MAG: OmpA family protein [Chitinophagales bacterium]|nr:OmpA family protein [Chitinophagales bacterium]